MSIWWGTCPMRKDDGVIRGHGPSSRTGSVSPLSLSQSYMEVDVRSDPLLPVSPGQASETLTTHARTP